MQHVGWRRRQHSDREIQLLLCLHVDEGGSWKQVQPQYQTLLSSTLIAFPSIFD